MDHNLDDLEFEDPLDGSLLDVSYQEEVGEQYTCGICDASYSTKQHLKRHLKAHDDRFSFQCRSCTQYFTTEDALISHKNPKHSAKSHLCTSCGKTFAKKAHLNVHQSRFHEPGPLTQSYQCHFEGCNKTFHQKEKFQDQMNIHTGSKPYSCGHCSKTFHGKYYRNSHEKICMGDQKTKCDICDQVLSDLSSLKRHKDAKHNKMVFTCYCGKVFAYQSSLNKHKKNKH